MEQVVIIDADVDSLARLVAFCKENNIAFTTDPSSENVENLMWEQSQEWDDSGC